MKIIVFGLSLSSSWGNGHAVTYRSLLKGLHALGCDVVFFERDTEWYAAHRDFTTWPHSQLFFYSRLSELAPFRHEISSADAIIIGSYVPDAGILYRMVRDLNPRTLALYDIDTPVTLANLRTGTANVFDRGMIADCDLYLSFTGGPTLDTIRREFKARLVRPLYCSVDPELHHPIAGERRYTLSYLGTFSEDRQNKLETLLLEAARTLPKESFCVAGAQYPEDLRWPENVAFQDHIPPEAHPAFYGTSQATLNLTRADMIIAGYSPSIRLFEAASCNTAILTDEWPGLDQFFTPGLECLVVRTTRDVCEALSLPSVALESIATAARQRTLASHTGLARAKELLSALDAATSFNTEISESPTASEPNQGMHVE